MQPVAVYETATNATVPRSRPIHRQPALLIGAPNGQVAIYDHSPALTAASLASSSLRSATVRSGLRGVVSTI